MALVNAMTESFLPSFFSKKLATLRRREKTMKAIAKFAKGTAEWVVFFVTGHGPVAIRAIEEGILDYSGQTISA